MGWVWKDDGEGSRFDLENRNPKFDVVIGNDDDGSSCTRRRIVRSNCKTEEIEPGRFIRKCEKTEEILKECIGKPVEVVKSNTEYTEEDITGKTGRSLNYSRSFDFSGPPSGFESVLESNMDFFEKVGGLGRVFYKAEEVMKDFFQVFDTPRVPEKEPPSVPFIREVPIQGQLETEAARKQMNCDDSAYSDFSGQVRDV